MFLTWCGEQPEYAALLPARNPAKTKKAREALGKAGVKKDVLQRGQLAAWFTAVQQLQSPVIAACLQMMLLTGARPGEVLALRWEDVRSGTIHVWRSVQVGSVKTAKGFASRTVPISPKLRKVLDTARPDGAEPGDLIAQAQRGEWLNWSMWGRKVWQPVRERLGLTGVAYDLRHTAASTWIMDGHDLLTVASWLGHAPAVTLDHYAHLFAEARTERASTSTAPKRARRPSARPASPPETRARGRSSARGTAARS